MSEIISLQPPEIPSPSPAATATSTTADHSQQQNVLLPTQRAVANQPHPAASNASSNTNSSAYTTTGPSHSRAGSNQKSPMVQKINAAKEGVQRIGPYNLGKTLGVGSSGRVKLGIHAETGLKVAIKIIPKESLSKDAAQKTNSEKPKYTINKKLEREITIMKLIQHPHLMQLYDVYETEKELFLILEHIEGGELFDYLVKKGRLPEKEALSFFQQIIFGVDFCHRHLICHRDLKPENLLLDKEMNIKIADFGMASLQVTGKMLETSCGSPHYACPEIIKGVKYDGPPADIWSCGVILYALLTGNLPFDDDNIRRLLSKVKSGMYYIPDFISADAKDLIKRMLVIEPSKRITMKEIFSHPWFNSHEPKLKEQIYPVSPPVSESRIDYDVVNSLGLLGWGTEEELKTALMLEGPNMEKVFYYLLIQRKYEFFENYDIRKLAEWDIEGGPRRRNDSYASLYSDKTGGSKFDLYRSEACLAIPESSPLRKSAEELHGRSNSNTPPVPGSPTSRKIAEPVALKPKPTAVLTTQSAAVKVNSPLSASMQISPSSPTEKTELRRPVDDSEPTPLSANKTHHAVSGSTPELSLPSTIREKPSNSSPRALRSGDDLGIRKKLTINIPAMSTPIGPTSAPVHPNQQSTGESKKEPTSPKFHRKKEKLEIPPTPIITQTPKRSWFASLFNFKPEVYEIISTLPSDKTIEAVENQMKACDIKYQARKEGGFKCKFDSFSNSHSSNLMPMSPNSPGISSGPSNSGLKDLSSDSSSKGTKFKIDLVQMDDGSVRIQFVQQQGSFSTFQAIVERFKVNWAIANGQ
ncbi:hypothetical protein HK098_002932 [Nowakowskiella sp. JEL0407]|nr:hypothetical protein HK098_002932 [Nowakowskiella sp. JEL0407]